MKKFIILLLSVMLVLSFSACGNAQKAKQAYDAIGKMSFSDESILTKEEREKLEELKGAREQALEEEDVEKLSSIKSQWEAFREPIQKFISKYQTAADTFLSEKEKALLTTAERSDYEELATKIENAYRGRDAAALEEAINAFHNAFGDIRELIKLYSAIDQNPVSEKEKALLSRETISKQEELKSKTEDALSARNLTLMKSLKNDWGTFTNDAKNEIETAKEKLLNDWVKGAKFTDSLGNLLSGGSVTSSTRIDGHKIIISSQYNYDIDEDAIKRALDSYLSWTSSMFEGGVKSLKTYIDDVCIRIEYKDKNGKVISSKEFK